MSNVESVLEAYGEYRRTLAFNGGLPFAPVNFPYERVDTEDAGSIMVALGDTELPAVWDEVVGDPRYADSLDVRPEYRVALDKVTFENHLRHLSKVGRSWKHTAKLNFNTVTMEQWLDLQPALGLITASNLMHFNPNIQNAIDVAYAYLAYVTEWMQLEVSDVVLISRLGASGQPHLCGFAMFQNCYRHEEYHWVNTVLMRDELTRTYCIGNVVLLQAMRLCYMSKTKYLNLGLSVFDYKKAWKPELFERPVLLAKE